MATLLGLCQTVADEVGILQPTTIIGSQDDTAIRLLSSAKRAAKTLHRAHPWTILHREHEFTTTEDDDNYAVPSDFGWLLYNTAYDRDQTWPMDGSQTPAQWQYLKSGIVSPAIRSRYRLQVGPTAGSVLIDPVPDTTGVTLVYEYVSTNWCESSAGTGQADWAADTDVTRLDPYLVELGMIWRIKQVLGMVYADDRDLYEVEVEKHWAREQALPMLDATGGRDDFPPFANQPDVDFGT